MIRNLELSIGCASIALRSDGQVFVGDLAGDFGGEEDASGRKGLLRGVGTLIGIKGGEIGGFFEVGKIEKWIRVLREVAIVVEFVDRAC